ncbi:MAG: glycosyltransferase [Chloroflexota bacterium]
MRNVLIVAYYFPPSGGPGVQRVLKHVKYLPEYGWNPVVLTVSNGQFPARDESLLKQIPESVPVYRTHIYEPYDLYRLLTGKKKGEPIDVGVIKKEDQKRTFKENVAELIRSTFFIPDARIGWLPTASKAAREIVEKRSIEAVYSSSPPYTCSIIARNIKRRTGLPWVAGFRDPWTGFISSPKRYGPSAAIDRRMELSVFREADFVECAWKGIIKDALGKYPQLPADKFIHVPNGFDSADYPRLDGAPAHNQAFTLTYTGSMYGRRNPAALFKAIEILLEKGLIIRDEFKLKFIGRFGPEVKEMFSAASFKKSLEIIDYMPHGESVKQLMLSDANLLVVDESKESAEIVPGKVYEYIGAGKPVFAIAPVEGAIAELIRETRAGEVAHQSDVEKIADILLRFIRNFRTGESFYNPNMDEIMKYERRESARALASLLDRSLARK